MLHEPDSIRGGKLADNKERQNFKTKLQSEAYPYTVQMCIWQIASNDQHAQIRKLFH